MFKIIAISCVLVGIVIPFHKVKGVNDIVYNPGDISLPQNVQIMEEFVNNSPISSDIEKLKHIKASIETSIQEFFGKIHTAQTACRIVYEESRDIINQTRLILNSCLKTNINETFIINTKIHKLIVSANNVKKTMAENMRATITECSQQPFNVTSCLGTINRNLAEINLKDLANVAMASILQKFPLLSYFSNIIRCYTDFRQHFTPQYFKGVSNDTKICYENIQKIFRP